MPLEIVVARSTARLLNGAGAVCAEAAGTSEMMNRAVEAIVEAQTTGGLWLDRQVEVSEFGMVL
jgi:hypothetical protein